MTTEANQTTPVPFDIFTLGYLRPFCTELAALMEGNPLTLPINHLLAKFLELKNNTALHKLRHAMPKAFTVFLIGRLKNSNPELTLVTQLLETRFGNTLKSKTNYKNSEAARLMDDINADKLSSSFMSTLAKHLGQDYFKQPIIFDRCVDAICNGGKSLTCMLLNNRDMALEFFYITFYSHDRAAEEAFQSLRRSDFGKLISQRNLEQFLCTVRNGMAYNTQSGAASLQHSATVTGMTPGEPEPNMSAAAAAATSLR